MIVLEGPDGGGKTTLLEQLCEEFPDLVVHPRASSSGPTGGPVADLYGWAREDVNSWFDRPLGFYDRHPLVSEYIYGPVCRGRIDPQFHATSLRRDFARRALLVVCLPPLEAVRASVSDDRDMPGVVTGIDAIWTLYASLRACWPVSTGIVHYDWTEPDAVVPVVHRIATHRERWSNTYD